MANTFKCMCWLSKHLPWWNTQQIMMENCFHHPLDSWVYGLLKDCVSVLIDKYLQPLENQAHDAYFMHLHILRDKKKSYHWL
uniref:Uncharacterized protein n=1 Tax=Malurus cyaneus samueli TaxID=2593467 RepID=A0A8C5X3R6_9PASS